MSTSIHLKLPCSQPPLPFPRVTLPTRPRPATLLSAAGTNSGSAAAPEPTLYDVLGVTSDGTLGEIKRAYREMARRYHPDVSPLGRVEEYTERFVRVREAYETLSDPSRRAVYDGDLSRGFGIGFSARSRCNDDEETEDKNERKNRWQSQFSELKRRSMYKNAQGNMSWGAKMRRQMSNSSNEV